MEEEQIKVFADSLWDYLLEKKLKQYLSDSVCYYMASVVEPASDGFITVQRPFDNAVTLPCGANAENLAVGDACAVLVFGDFSNQIVIGNVAELTGKITITDATETTLNGVLAGNGSTVGVKPVDSAPTANSQNLVSSGGTDAAIQAVKGLAQATAIASNSDLNNFNAPGVYYCVSGTVAATLSNTPITAVGFELFVAPINSSTDVIQLAYSNSSSGTTRMYVRRKNGSTWYNWGSTSKISSITETSLNGVLAGNGSTVSAKTVDTAPDSTHTDNLISSAAVANAVAESYFSMTMGALSGGSDLNDVSPGSIYQLYTNRTYANTPGGANLWGLLICLSPSKSLNQKYQVILSTSGHVYYRAYDGSNWLSWREITFSVVS